MARRRAVGVLALALLSTGLLGAAGPGLALASTEVVDRSDGEDDPAGGALAEGIDDGVVELGPEPSDEAGAGDTADPSPSITGAAIGAAVEPLVTTSSSPSAPLRIAIALPVQVGPESGAEYSMLRTEVTIEDVSDGIVGTGLSIRLEVDDGEMVPTASASLDNAVAPGFTINDATTVIRLTRATPLADGEVVTVSVVIRADRIDPLGDPYHPWGRGVFGVSAVAAPGCSITPWDCAGVDAFAEAVQAYEWGDIPYTVSGEPLQGVRVEREASSTLTLTTTASGEVDVVVIARERPASLDLPTAPAVLTGEQSLVAVTWARPSDASPEEEEPPGEEECEPLVPGVSAVCPLTLVGATGSPDSVSVTVTVAGELVGRVALEYRVTPFGQPSVALGRRLDLYDVVAPLAITTESLPPWAANEPGQDPFSLEASGGHGGLAWSLAAGTLPLGVELSSDGELSGSPSSAGQHDVTFRVEDALGDAAEAELTLVVSDVDITISAPDGPVVAGATVRFTVMVTAAADGGPVAGWSSGVRVIEGFSVDGLTAVTTGIACPSPQSGCIVATLVPGESEVFEVIGRAAGPPSAAFAVDGAAVVPVLTRSSSIEFPVSSGGGRRDDPPGTIEAPAPVDPAPIVPAEPPTPVAPLEPTAPVEPPVEGGVEGDAAGAATDSDRGADRGDSDGDGAVIAAPPDTLVPPPAAAAVPVAAGLTMLVLGPALASVMGASVLGAGAGAVGGTAGTALQSMGGPSAPSLELPDSDPGQVFEDEDPDDG